MVLEGFVGKSLGHREHGYIWATNILGFWTIKVSKVSSDIYFRIGNLLSDLLYACLKM